MIPEFLYKAISVYEYHALKDSKIFVMVDLTIMKKTLTLLLNIGEVTRHKDETFYDLL